MGIIQDKLRKNELSKMVRKGKNLSPEEHDEFQKFFKMSAKEHKAEYDKEQEDKATLKAETIHKFGVDLKPIIEDTEGYYYFGKKDINSVKYKLIGFDWDGPLYEEIQETVTTGKDKKKGRLGRTLLGGAVLGPVGAIAGAAGSRKTDVNRKSITTTRQVEKKASAILHFVTAEANEPFDIKFNCDSSLANKVRGLRMHKISSQEKIIDPHTISKDSQSESSSSFDPYEEVKKAKELMDMGIITEDEFNQKKKELLNL
ncbi:MAG: SHOCT domain-containing protein [Coprobacillaceae bacterium]